MNPPISIGVKTAGLPGELRRRKSIILGELRERSLWFIRLRWLVPPSIAAGVGVGHVLGFDFPTGALLLTGLFILVYNAGLARLSRRLQDPDGTPQPAIQRFTYYQVALDYSAMFLLIHFTGGAASPFIFFFIFHIIFASILLPPRSAHAFAALVAVGMGLVAAAEYLGAIEHHAIYHSGRAINLAEQPYHMMVELGFFAASVCITAFSTTAIMKMLKKRILDLAEVSEAVSDLNNKLGALYAMIQAIGSVRGLDRLLNLVATELAAVMQVKAISIKLLSPDGKRLSYAASHGLPEEFTREKIIDLDKSPLNRRIIEGEPFVTSRVSAAEGFQFGGDLIRHQLQSVLFAPLKVEKRAIGILGAYGSRAEGFAPEEVDFFQLAAGLVAIALENARYYEEIEKMVKERSWFMMRIAHNLRAPLAASMSILDVVQNGYLGDLNERQASYLRRIEYPLRNMLSMINEIMVLYAQRSEKRQVVPKFVDLGRVMERIHRIFQEEAQKKEIKFSCALPEQPVGIHGDEEMLEQLLENLVSNAIKYTRSGGQVRIACARDQNDHVLLEVSDNGIGIPKDSIPRVFTEFYRADNAKEFERVGTGLGLPIVKEIVNQHGGTIKVESEEGLGSVFVARFKAAFADQAAPLLPAPA